jgi:hypothetical protein
LLPVLSVFRGVYKIFLGLLLYHFHIEMNPAIGDVAHVKRRGLPHGQPPFND